MTDTPCRIKPRRQGKGDIAGRHLRRVYTGNLRQRLQAAVAPVGNLCQAVSHEHAVFPCQGDKIRNRAQSDQGRIPDKVFLVPLPPQSPAKRVRHTDAGQFFTGVGATGLFRVKDRIGIGYPVGRFVMIRNNDIRLILELFNQLNRGNPAVNGNDQVRPFFDQFFQRFPVEAVALGLTFGNIKDRVTAEI